MRILVFISNMVLGVSLIAGSVNVYAASIAKAHKHSYGKSKRSSAVAKQKIPEPPNVWHRVGAGLRLPRPDLALAAYNAQLNENKYSYLQSAGARYSQTLPPAPAVDSAVAPEKASDEKDSMEEVAAKTNPMMPAKALPPKDNYTALGRKLRGSAPVSLASSDCDPVKNKQKKLEALRPLKTRVRTEFNYYPELHKHTGLTTKTLAYKAFAENSEALDNPCVEAEPKKVVRLAQNTPVLPTPSQTDVAQSPQALENEMQLLAAKQKEQEAQRSAKLTINNERVNKFVNWYAQRQAYLYEVTERARPYLYHVVEILHNHHLPMDLALLPIVESAYQPTAQSPMSAAGLWQFIPSTGNDYNLKQDIHYDERLDIAESTEAAASYLNFLHQRFKGDWLLALAAYNCGIGRVEDAISQNIAAGLDTDYWSLQLPEETQAYVPRLLALSKIFANPAAYKVKLAPIRDELYFINVKVDRKQDIQILANKDLKSIAELADVPFEHFTKLNPGFLEPTLPPDRSFSFLMPIANANQLYDRLYSLAKAQEVPPEEAQPAAIVSELKSPVSPLAEAEVKSYDLPMLSLNVNMPVPDIKVVEAPKPVELGVSRSHKNKPTQDKYLAVHYVDKGENLITVAKQFDVSVESVRTLNKLKRKQGVFVGQRLIIPPKQAKTIMLEAANGEVPGNVQAGSISGKV